ncbi:MAG: MEDS domain-containing protein, partial [Chloroflexota bacterium]
GGAPTVAGLLETIGGRLERAVAEGYRVIRFLGFIAWDSPGWPDEAALLDFESQVNEVVTAYPAVIVCTYGVPTLAGTGLIYGGLLTHPISIIRGRVIRDSPFYVPPPKAAI